MTEVSVDHHPLKTLPLTHARTHIHIVTLPYVVHQLMSVLPTGRSRAGSSHPPLGEIGLVSEMPYSSEHYTVHKVQKFSSPEYYFQFFLRGNKTTLFMLEIYFALTFNYQLDMYICIKLLHTTEKPIKFTARTINWELSQSQCPPCYNKIR
jgi:hypothetical protein